MKNKTGLLDKLKKILKEVRFGNFSSRLDSSQFSEDKEFVNDFNKMIESLEDRESMLKENQVISLAKTEYLKTLFNMLNEGAMTISEDFKILSINNTQMKWFHQKKKDLIGAYLADILKKYKIFDSSLIENPLNLEEFLEKDRKNFILTFELKKIKMTFSINVKSFLLKDGTKNYFIISKDITSDVQLQKLKDTFIATLTHDLKVPIVAEAKVIELLLKETLGENTIGQKEALENMLMNNKDMMNLVMTLLDVYKLEEGAFKITKTQLNLLDLLDNEINKLKFLQTESSATFKIKNTATNTIIDADEREIGRVLKNLLSNAMNFAPQGSKIIIKISEDEQFLSLSVTDSGSGISPKNIPYIFDRYFTSDKKFRKVGTGLGLYLSKKIIQLHGGEIFVNSVLNKETTFTIRLPK